jgi:uncharacterized protein
MHITNDRREPTAPDRILGDEWLDWEGRGAPEDAREGKRTFLLLSLLVLAGFVLLGILFWYLVLPRFEQYGGIYATILTVAVAGIALFFLVWYALLSITVLSKRLYLRFCLQRGAGLFLMLFPVVSRVAKSLGISRDRLSHSFIEVSNTLAGTCSGDGQILALIPRCLKGELKREIRRMCADFPDVILHTTPGGTEARRVIREHSPKAIVAVACERDLVTGIHDVAPRIPVIGIPNTRPLGPCKDTAIDLDKFRRALSYFSRKA